MGQSPSRSSSVIQTGYPSFHNKIFSNVRHSSPQSSYPEYSSSLGYYQTPIRRRRTSSRRRRRRSSRRYNRSPTRRYNRSPTRRYNGSPTRRYNRSPTRRRRTSSRRHRRLSSRRLPKELPMSQWKLKNLKDLARSLRIKTAKKNKEQLVRAIQRKINKRNKY